MICPKCEFEQPDGGAECPRCGVVFARYSRQPPAVPAATREPRQGMDWQELLLEEEREPDPAGDPPWAVDLSGKVVLCFGGEEKGLRARTRQLCDRTIGLPMRGRVGSLNIATSAAAVLYEAVRQRSR